MLGTVHQGVWRGCPGCGGKGGLVRMVNMSVTREQCPRCHGEGQVWVPVHPIDPKKQAEAMQRAEDQLRESVKIVGADIA